MISQSTNKGRKWTNIILAVITLAIIVYLAYMKGFISLGQNHNVQLEATVEMLSLEAKEKSVIGLCNKQIYKVTMDGITTYNFEGTQIWTDTFSMSNFAVKQKGDYIVVGERDGKNLLIFNNKGRKAEITTNAPIIYFSLNEDGSIVTVEKDDNAHIVSAYTNTGKYLLGRTSYTSTDGYPTAVTLSPDNKLLLISYVSVNDPQVNSTILAIDVQDNQTENIDNVKFGYEHSNNLVYALEFMDNDTWVCIGDQAITWYDKAGNKKGEQQGLSLVFVPELIKTGIYGREYLPLIVSEKPTQNIIHRQDKLIYYDEMGMEAYNISLEGGVEGYYADENGVILKMENSYKGFNKLGNQIFEYIPTVDVSQVIYMPSMKKGIAVSKDKVFLLTPKKEQNKG